MTEVAAAERPPTTDKYADEEFEKVEAAELAENAGHVDAFKPSRAQDDGVEETDNTHHNHQSNIRERKPTGGPPSNKDEAAHEYAEDDHHCPRKLTKEEREDLYGGKHAWRHYHTLYPVCNRLLAKKWDDLRRAKHKDKLAKMKNGIDDKPPVLYKLKGNPKKEQQDKERRAEIIRNNYHMVEKMQHILRVEKIAEDTKDMDERIQRSHKRMEAVRRLNAKRIQQQNLFILERLENCKSDYDHIRGHTGTVKNLIAAQNLSMFPQRYDAMIKAEMEREMKDKSQKGKPRQPDPTRNDEHHARHHWHGPYGGNSVRGAVEAFGFGGAKIILDPNQQSPLPPVQPLPAKTAALIKQRALKPKNNDATKVAPSDVKVMKGQAKKMKTDPALPAIPVIHEVKVPREDSPLKPSTPDPNHPVVEEINNMDWPVGDSEIAEMATSVEKMIVSDAI